MPRATKEQVIEAKAEMLRRLEQGHAVQDALRFVGRSERAYHQWRRNDKQFRTAADRAKEAGKRVRAVASVADDDVFDPERPRRKVPSFREFRPTYIGRPVTRHQEPIVDAWGDQTNLAVVVLGYPGMGKDTIAGDFALHESADWTKRVAWLMESEAFSRRRLAERVAPYLTDYRTYDVAPRGPGCVKPKRNMIDDFGPFAWKAGLLYPDGTPVPRPTWNKHEMYFIGRASEGALEADPNLWATGVTGTTYGARIDTAILSDPFTMENQGSPVVMADQMNWLHGTFMSRLDEGGRLLALGTMLPIDNNWLKLIADLAGQSPVIDQTKHMTKYANGVAVVRIPAIDVDENGDERSAWPERFPLRSKLILPKGEEFYVDELDETEQRDLATKGARRIRGLYEIRERSPSMFEAMYQQVPPTTEIGEFTQQLLDHCDDRERTIGRHRPGERLVLGIDPARTGGAAWVLWGLDEETGVSTIVDFFIGDRLGISGIRNKLLIGPVTRYWPREAVYEYNREEGVLEHPDVKSALDGTGCELKKHYTNANRSVGETQVAAMVFDMRSGLIRFPAQTVEDRQKMQRLKQHFRNFDRRTFAEGRRSAYRAATHGLPDDGAMAAWVGWVRIKETSKRGSRGVTVARPVPLSVQRKWSTGPVDSGPSTPVAPPSDLVAVWHGEQ